MFLLTTYIQEVTNMGRKKLNRTKEETNEQSRIRMQRYYDNHKDKILEKRMRRYWEGKKIKTEAT